MELKFGTLLKYGSYRIESVLGQGGFGITYLAEQVGLNRQVAIKEFFMKEYCNRDETTSQVSVPSAGSKDLVNRFKAKFIKEAQTIAKLNHPNIIRIHDIFEENGTAYYVMEYHGKGSLSELLKSKGKLPESEALRYIRQVADALSYIHERNMNHLDVKPGNILLDEEGNAVLIDFGMSKRYDEAGNQTSTTPVGISHGYAPMEQYKKGGVSAFSPATDIYSLGATLYKLITGETPPEADEVYEEGLPELSATISKSVRAAIESAMQPKRKDRPQSIAEFLQLLEEAETVTETKFEAEESAESEATTFAAQEKETPKKRGWLYGAIACVVAAVVLVGGLSVRKNKSNEELAAQYKTTGSVNGHEYVDLGLSVKWATCNVGATTPEGYGDYFAWGETAPKRNYTWKTYKFRTSGDRNDNVKFNKYNTSSDNGTVDNKTTLDLSDDAARINWGGSWRMPTRAEQDELRDNCTWTWTTKNGKKGYKVTSKTNGNSIFLPAAGLRDGRIVYDVGSYGYYWSSSLDARGPDFADILDFYSGYVDWLYGDRDNGHTVRAVCGDNTVAQTFTISFNANGGSGKMSVQPFETGVSQAITANTFTCSGYTFTGWNTNADGSGTAYTDKQLITLTKDIKLYAQWKSSQVVSGSEKGYEWVDLGLPSGLKWATCNVGATTPEGYGDYFAWGETSPKSNYTWETYKFRTSGESHKNVKFNKYNTSSDRGTIDNKTTLDLSDDAARVNWGGTWRMPTEAEQNELRNNCTWTWTTQNGIKGYKVTSKTNGNSIFLPAASYRYGTSVYDVGSAGYYWSSSLNESFPRSAYELNFESGWVDWPSDSRERGHTVRAVCP